MSVSFEELPEAAPFDEASFNDGSEKRLPVIFLLDTSQSMGRGEQPKRPIDELNRALDTWADEIRQTPSLTRRVEIALITFGKGGVQTRRVNGQEFCPAGTFQAPTPLEAEGVTPMIEAINTAINLSEKRKRQLDATQNPRIFRLRTMVFIVTDGAPTNNAGKPLAHADLKPMAGEIAKLEESKKLGFFAAGVSGADFDALKTLAPQGWWDLTQGSFAAFLKEASTSLGAVDPIQAMREHIAQARS